MKYKFRKKLNEDITNNSFEEKVAEVKQQLQNGARPRDVFDAVWYFHEGFAMVKLNGKMNFIDTNNKILCDLWFDDVWNFEGNFAVVKLGYKFNFINTDGELLSDLWFDEVWNFEGNFARVRLSNKWNFIKPDGNILHDDLWFDYVDWFHNGFVTVILNGNACSIDTNGNLYDENKNPIDNVTENRRRVLRITESQLRNTIKSVITQYLNESRRR